MATIVARNKKYCVISYYDSVDGKRHQKWKTFDKYEDAKNYKLQIEYSQELGEFETPKCTTMRDLLKEYVALYGKTKWSLSMYSSNMGLIRNYIEPFLGDTLLSEVTPRTLERLYQNLMKTPAVPSNCVRKGKKTVRLITAGTIKKINNLLRSAFNQAEKWELVERNPARLVTLPKVESKEREIWDSQTLFHAIECCDDERLKLCLNLAFACSLRLGELLGLTWDNIDVSPESMLEGKASIHVTKELQRVSKKAVDALEEKDIVFRFPEQGRKNTTVLVLKKPKTLSSIRKVFLPKTVAEMLITWKMEQDNIKEALGDEYNDYNLVICTPTGCPTEGSRIREAMQRLIKENNLPPVVFHSLRHSSITYKLKLNGGDIKAVQGDSGHAQATMVTEQYSHILDEGRQTNAQLIEEAFYAGKGAEKLPPKEPEKDPVTEQAAAAGVDPAELIKILSNPAMVNLLKSLSQTIGAT